MMARLALSATAAATVVDGPRAAVIAGSAASVPSGDISNCRPVFWLFSGVLLGGGAWTAATTSNGFTNWSVVNLPVSVGANVFSAYSADAAGNVSKTVTLKFTGTPP